jgi:hypothetical protein
MPVAFTIDTRGVIRTRCTGNVTLDEVLDHLRTLEEDPCRPGRVDVLLDLSEADSLPQSGQIRAVGDELGVRTRMRFGACAIVTPSDALFGMMRMFEAVAQEHFRAIHVFRTAAEAEAWLLSEQSRSSVSEVQPKKNEDSPGGLSG